MSHIPGLPRGERVDETSTTEWERGVVRAILVLTITDASVEESFCVCYSFGAHTWP